MISSKLIADSINCSHLIGMTIFGITPVLPFLIEFATHREKKHSNKLYIGLGLINSGVLFSYYIYQDVCLLSICENYFCPDKYTVYKVSPNVKSNLFASTICLGLQAFFDNFKFRSITVASYYLVLFSNYFIS